jgi:phosphoribosylanthranilate isomerase
MANPGDGTFLIKICGVTTPEDAVAAVDAGADAIGVNLWPGSKRFVGDRAAARRVVGAIRPGVLKVGVFVNAPCAAVVEAMSDLGLDRAQLHGDELPGDFQRLPRASVIRAVRVRDEGSLHAAAGWQGAVMLLDAFVDGYGGGGVPAPWALIAARATRPFLLAGGLTPDNVAEAVRVTCPDGVDVASGVERAPGRKDAAKVAAFVRAARAAARAVSAGPGGLAGR